MGCEAVPQVGVSGYFLDIGVRHKEWPHGFLLGVECDGANYHSAKSARDRDRLRQEVLEGLGWYLHRIWSTDWFGNPQREAEKLRTVITSRLTELKQREFEYTGATRRTENTESLRNEPVVSTTFHIKKSSADGHAANKPSERSANGRLAVAVGDTVRVKYLTGDQKTRNITIDRRKSNPSQGIVGYDSPIAKALLDAEEGEEVEVLVGSFVRPAIVESIIKCLV